MPLEDELSDILKKARMGQGLTAQALAQRAGLSTADVTALERNDRAPSPEQVRALATALGLRAEPLLEIAAGNWAPHPVDGRLKGVEPIYGDIGGYTVTGYLLYDGEGGDGLLIDTAYNPSAVLACIDRHQVTLRVICLTHGHADHADGLDEILAQWPVPVYLGEADLPLLSWRPPAHALRLLSPEKEGETIEAGSLEVRSIVTPGHTPGGLCFLDEARQVCFVGDTLFAGSIGRANPFSLYPQHLASVRKRLMALPPSMVLLPGHGPGTTVVDEQAHNPFVGTET